MEINGSLTNFKRAVLSLYDLNTTNIESLRKEFNIYDFLILRRSREGNEVCAGTTSFSAKKLILLGWPISKYHLFPGKLELTTEKKQIAKKIKYIATLKTEKDIRALYDLQDYGSGRRSVERILKTLGVVDPATLNLLLALGGIDLLEYSTLLSHYPNLQGDIQKASLPTDKKKLPKITDLLDPFQIFPIKVLGSGSYGAVFVVWIWGYGRAVLKLATPSFPLSLIGECMLLRTLGCENPNVLCLRECIKLPKQFGLITDYYEGYVDLVTWSECIKSEHRNETAFNSILATVFRQILLGVQYIHSKKMAHRDIKPGNIILKWDTPMIIDFGASWSLGLSKEFPGWAGTVAYMPPKLVDAFYKQHLPTFDQVVKADLWAVGASLFDIVAGIFPDNEFFKRHSKIKPPFKEVCEGLMKKGWSAEQAIKVLADIEKK